jgi:hypothetical protein
MTGAEMLAVESGAVSPQARSIAREHAQWMRQQGMSLASLGRTLDRRIWSWREAWVALAIAWAICCGPAHGGRRA